MIKRKDFDLAVAQNTIEDRWVSWDGVYDDLCELYPSLSSGIIADAMCEFQRGAQ